MGHEVETDTLGMMINRIQTLMENGKGGPCSGIGCQLGDNPGVNDDWKNEMFRQEFETCAVCLDKESKEYKDVYACVTWGHHFDFNGKKLLRWWRWVGSPSNPTKDPASTGNTYTAPALSGTAANPPSSIFLGLLNPKPDTSSIISCP